MLVYDAAHNQGGVQRPRLVEFGSVRNLTGGSRTNGNDAGCNFSMNGLIRGMCMV